MAAPTPSSLSTICKAIATYLSNQVNTPEVVASVVIGTPSDAQPAEAEDSHKINLFFYKFEPYGFRPDILPGETDWLRAHCLITPFSVTEDNVSAGEIDLRLLGEVLRVFHEKPVQTVQIDEVDYHVQTIPQALGMEELNQVWSTQGDVPYRASVAYEMALAPIVPKKAAVQSPWAGAVGTEVVADIGRRFDEVSTGATAPLVGMLAVNGNLPKWAPVMCMVFNDQAIQSQVIQVGDAVLNDFKVKAWVAGAIGAKVTLQWHIWKKADGWTDQDVDDPADVNIKTDVIDADHIVADQLVEVALPITDEASQMVLYAIRTVTKTVGDQDITETYKSNPVMITLFEVAP